MFLIADNRGCQFSCPPGQRIYNEARILELGLLLWCLGWRFMSPGCFDATFDVCLSCTRVCFVKPSPSVRNTLWIISNHSAYVPYAVYDYHCPANQHYERMAGVLDKGHRYHPHNKQTQQGPTNNRLQLMAREGKPGRDTPLNKSQTPGRRAC